MGLPAPPGTGSCNSAILNTKLIPVILRLKLMFRRSLLIALDHRRRPEKVVEFITVEIAASELRFWSEKAGWEEKSIGKLKFLSIFRPKTH